MGAVIGRCGWLAMLIGLGGAGWFASRAVAEPAAECELMAMQLCSLTEFVEWPAESFTTPETPWVIAVLGRDPLGQALVDAARAESRNRRRIVVKCYANIETLGSCDILFVNESEAGELQRIFARLKGRPILSVGNFEGFAKAGGMIRFKNAPDGKLRLRINLASMRESGLTASAKLLRVAEDVALVPK